MSTPTAQVPEISLPSHMRPSDGRFGSGPSKVRQEAVEALALAAPTYLGTSHRHKTVKSVVARVRAGLSTLFSLPGSYEVAIGNGGAAFFWDIATFSLIRRHSQHVVFGQFSSSFAATVAAAPHLDDPEIIESDPGTRCHPRPAEDIDTYALIHNETSTGVAAPVTRPDIPEDALVLVDATSAAGGLPVDPAQFDAYYFSPQKCFGADGGLWLALLSPAAVERARETQASGRWAPASLSLPVALDNSRADQTYNTPALATLYLMADQIEWMLDQGGLEWAVARCARSAATVYRWAEASPFAEPFVTDPADRSDVVATVDLDPSVDAGTVSQVLRANGIVDTEAYRRLGRNQLRIAVYPSVDPDDVAVLTAAIDHVVAALA